MADVSPADAPRAPAMLLRLRSSTPERDLDSLLRIARELGYEPRLLDEGRRVLLLEGPGRPGHRSVFEDHSAVAQVLDAEDAPELTARAWRADRVVSVRDARFGGDRASLIAGPCAVEDERRLLEIAHAVRAAGGAVLRGGAFKPRTSPYSFQGLGVRGLEMLARAREETGLAIVTEVLDPRNVGVVHEVTDMFQVGSRGMANSPLLRELGTQDKPVLLKRGMAATVREFLLAAEYVLAGGNEDVVLCERGVRGFDSVTRNVLDVGAIAHLKRVTHLPVIADPSHAAGRSELVRPLARAGLAAGADGLIVEVHPAPGEVHSDGAQAISLEELDVVAREARALLGLLGKGLAAPPADSRRDAAPSSKSGNAAGPAALEELKR
jgi:3-deoxy-7-phosphoheptulonate synthase